MKLTSYKQIEEFIYLLTSAMRHVDEAVLITTKELDLPGPEIVYVNEGFCRMTGYAAEEVIGKTPRILQGPKTDRAELDRLRRCLSRGKPFKGGEMITTARMAQNTSWSGTSCRFTMKPER
jgi:PAS domain S-box-containing protein